MKRITILKTTSHIQMGHVYEHVFAACLTQFFSEKNFFAYLDYDIEATVFYSGHILIEVRLYTKEIEQYARDIATLVPAFNEDVIDGALIQIMAEKQVDVKTIDREVLNEYLRQMQKKPWQQYSQLKIIGKSDIKKTKKGLAFISRSPQHFLVLRQDILLRKKNLNKTNNLLPLFVVIADILRTNLQETIANTSYCYSYDDSFTASSEFLKDTNLYRIDKRQATELTTERNEAVALLKHMKDSGIITRISQDLQNVDHRNPYGAPSNTALLDKIGVAVGDEGWREIGTPENIEFILKLIVISFRLGKSRSSIDLIDIFA